MRGAMLFAAGLFAGLAMQVMTAQNTNSGVVMMNHVGISVPNIAEAVTYYTQKMGYREAFRVNDDKGQPRLVYMQISKNTFLELNPVTAQRPAGFSHYGLHVQNAAQAVADTLPHAQRRTLEGLGIIPNSIEAVVPDYLWRFRKTGQFHSRTA